MEKEPINLCTKNTSGIDIQLVGSCSTHSVLAGCLERWLERKNISTYSSSSEQKELKKFPDTENWSLDSSYCENPCSVTDYENDDENKKIPARVSVDTLLDHTQWRDTQKMYRQDVLNPVVLICPSIHVLPNDVFITQTSYKFFVRMNTDINLKRRSWINICRICYGTDSFEELIEPCKCRGSVAYAHHTCLERWLKESMRNHCELCRHRYHIIRTPKYGVFKGILVWLFFPGEHTKELLKDIVGFFVYTPTALLATYLLLVSCENIRQMLLVRKSMLANFMAFIAISVVSLGMASIDFAYSSWLILRIRRNVDAWRDWWLSNCQLMLILPDKHGAVLRKSAETIEF